MLIFEIDGERGKERACAGMRTTVEEGQRQGNRGS